MENKVYIGNLAYGTTQDELRDEFSQCGEVSDVAIIMDRETGRSKGFGFITFETEEGFNAAIEKDNVEVGGRSLRVRKAEQKQKRFN
ncbi:RNA-binding protein [bacterium]|jgi:cold-inducible RNA-binding protein|nr:RNA-binding protein [bacterium]